ncbi:hypothetical protein [Flavobacterium sp.]|uniref:hypothetical protein n=1 Tax=Flavobacterium sp. TaxID=239 RepID=UPI00286CEABB|nr:hypothetical protein [Flavobacterium sp.]
MKKFQGFEKTLKDFCNATPTQDHASNPANLKSKLLEISRKVAKAQSSTPISFATLRAKPICLF